MATDPYLRFKQWRNDFYRCHTADDYRRYIDKYRYESDNTFLSQAHERLAELSKPAPKPVAPPTPAPAPAPVSAPPAAPDPYNPSDYYVCPRCHRRVRIGVRCPCEPEPFWSKDTIVTILIIVGMIIITVVGIAIYNDNKEKKEKDEKAKKAQQRRNMFNNGNPGTTPKYHAIPDVFGFDASTFPHPEDVIWM